MANEHLQLEPHESSWDWCWYEVPAGIEIVDIPHPIRLIRWSSIRAALRRKDKPSEIKKRKKKSK